MECWICVHGVRTEAPPVGICLNCHICACDLHADRPTRDRFWCFVCLQKILLDKAGFPIFDDEAEPTPDTVVTDQEVASAYARIEPFREVYAEAFDRLQYSVPIALDREVERQAFEIALALAALSAGPEALLEPEIRAGRIEVIDRRLVEYLEQGVPA